MKKQLVCILAAAAMLPGATVFATGSYNPENNEVSINDTTKTTVMIARNTGAKMTSNDLVYVGQEDEGFSNVSFALKENLPVGFYTIMLGGDGKAADKKTFFIGKETNLENNFKNKIELTALKEIVDTDANNSTVTKAYVSSASVELANAKSIVVKVGDRYVCQESDIVTSGPETVMLAVKLEGIPEGDKDNVNVWISSTEISTKDLITN